MKPLPTRCEWASSAPDFPQYHDEEWGIPVSDDRLLFEKLCLETFQSGLSWRTILTKRKDFREAFQGFDIDTVAAFTDNDVDTLMENSRLIRNRRKINAVINNAKVTQQIIKEEGSLGHFLWRYEPKDKPLKPATQTTCKESIELAKALKKRGWQFIGPTIAYAFMQSMGFINDHEEGCFMRDVVEKARDDFTRP